MGAIEFEKIEKTLRSRKWSIVLGNASSPYSQLKFTKQGLTNPPKDLAELIYRLLCKKEGTFYITSPTVVPKIKVQCYSDRLRSVQDLFNVAVNYDKNLSYKQLHDIVEDLKHLPTQLLCSNYCYVVKRQVHHAINLTVTEDKIRNAIGKRNIKF